jgi:hypothetical protein
LVAGVDIVYKRTVGKACVEEKSHEEFGHYFQFLGLRVLDRAMLVQVADVEDLVYQY